MQIERARISDAKSIVKINIQEWRNTYKGIFPEEYLRSLKSSEEESIKKCEQKIAEYIVCRINRRVVGFLRFGSNKKGYSLEYAEVYALYVDKAYQGQGIGRALIHYAFHILKKEYSYVLISTLVDNKANQFYLKMGGKLIGTSEFVLASNHYKENVYEFAL